VRALREVERDLSADRHGAVEQLSVRASGHVRAGERPYFEYRWPALRLEWRGGDRDEERGHYDGSYT
jgi:hypothetical protein